MPGAQAQAAFDKGERHFRRGMYPEAQKDFDDVKTKFVYSPLAARSELREADILFRQARYAEASDAYRSFIRFHPKHAEVGYARGQIAESQLAQVPEDWWFMPPVAEKDQSALRSSIEAYEDLLASAPSAAQTARAHEKLLFCRSKLAEHELYVARFYHKRYAYKGARRRAEALLAERQPDAIRAEALWLAGSSAQAIGEPEAAQLHLKTLVADFPTSRQAKRAQSMLDKTAREAGKRSGT